MSSTPSSTAIKHSPTNAINFSELTLGQSAIFNGSLTVAAPATERKVVFLVSKDIEQTSSSVSQQFCNQACFKYDKSTCPRVTSEYLLADPDPKVQKEGMDMHWRSHSILPNISNMPKRRLLNAEPRFDSKATHPITIHHTVNLQPLSCTVLGIPVAFDPFWYPEHNLHFRLGDVLKTDKIGYFCTFNRARGIELHLHNESLSVVKLPDDVGILSVLPENVLSGAAFRKQDHTNASAIMRKP